MDNPVLYKQLLSQIRPARKQLPNIKPHGISLNFSKQRIQNTSKTNPPNQIN